MASSAVSELFADPRVEAIVILDSDGRRIGAKYYTDKPAQGKARTAFEETLFKKTSGAHSARNEAEAILVGNFVAVYSIVADVHYYVLAKPSENELIMLSVLGALESSMDGLLRQQVDKVTLINNLDLLLLTIDEIVDDGVILETDFTKVMSRVLMRGAVKDLPLAEQSLSQAIQTARDQWFR